MSEQRFIVNGCLVTNTLTMTCLRTALFSLLFICLLAGCDKDVATPSCEEFRSAIKAGDKEKLREIIDSYIDQSSALTHTAANLDKLVKHINSNCDVQATVLCFGCIETLPEMSEIKLRYTDGIDAVEGVIDLSAYSKDDHRMKFVSVH